MKNLQKMKKDNELTCKKLNGLEALKRIKSYFNPKQLLTKEKTLNDLDNIEKELKEGETNKHLLDMLLEAISYCYSKTDGTYGDLALPVAYKVKYSQKVLYEHLPIETSKDKRDKALEIIKKKNVKIEWLKHSNSVEKYNQGIGDTLEYLTQEEYDLLKEVLIND